MTREISWFRILWETWDQKQISVLSKEIVLCWQLLVVYPNLSSCLRTSAFSWVLGHLKKDISQSSISLDEAIWLSSCNGTWKCLCGSFSGKLKGQGGHVFCILSPCPVCSFWNVVVLTGNLFGFWGWGPPWSRWSWICHSNLGCYYLDSHMGEKEAILFKWLSWDLWYLQLNLQQ